MLLFMKILRIKKTEYGCPNYNECLRNLPRELLCRTTILTINFFFNEITMRRIVVPPSANLFRSENGSLKDRPFPINFNGKWFHSFLMARGLLPHLPI